MIFELFLGYIALALAMVVIGYYVDIKVLSVLGFATLFLLGLAVNLSGLTYKSGFTETNSYMCVDCVGNSIPDLLGNSSVIASTTTVFDYSAMNDQASLWIARWLMIVSVLGASLVFASNRVKGADDE
jgi:hypothetical protein